MSERVDEDEVLVIENKSELRILRAACKRHRRVRMADVNRLTKKGQPWFAQHAESDVQVLDELIVDLNELLKGDKS